MSPDQSRARIAGALFLVTFATSIPAVFWAYAPALQDPAYILGPGAGPRLPLGALMELVLILANLGTALALYPLLAPHFPGLSLSYVAARLVECGFIALGLTALMALETLRAEGGDPASLAMAGRVLVALHDWTFRIGPGVVVGLGNGLILGWMMWSTRALPRGLSALGLIGGPLILASGAAVMLGLIPAGGGVQGLATLPEFLWELSLGLWLLLRGLRIPG